MMATASLWWSRFIELLEGLFGLRELYEAHEAAQRAGSGEVALRGLAAVAMVACTLMVAVRLAWLLIPRRPVRVPVRWAAVAALGTFVATLGFHVLRSLHVFKVWAAVPACLMLAGLAWGLGRGQAPLGVALTREVRAVRAVLALFRRSRYGLVNGVFAGFAAIVLLRTLIIPPLCWDTLTYHGTRGALWLQTGQFTFDVGPGPFDLYRHFFSGSEVLTAWALVPFHSDLLANLATGVQWLWVGIASWAFARALGLREPYAATSAGVTLFVPTLWLEVGSGYVEPALNAALLTGGALALAYLRGPSVGSALAAAASLGVAAGTKVPAVPPAAVLFVVLTLSILIRGSVSPLRRFGWVAGAALVAVLPASPWPLYAWYETGAPLSPMPIRILGVTLGKVSHALAWYQERPHVRPFEWDVEKRALQQLLSPLNTYNESLGALAIIPMLAVPLGLLWMARRRPIQALIATACMAPLVLFHFSASLSVPRIMWAVSVSRYVITLLAFAIPVGLFAASPARGGSEGLFGTTYRRVLLIYPLFYAGFFLRWGWGYWELLETAGTALLLAVLGSAASFAFRRGARVGTAVALAAVLLACSVLQARRDATRHLAFQYDFALHPFSNHWASAVKQVDEPRGAHRIAVTGGPSQDAHDWFIYPFMGARFQNTIHYVPPTRDGRVAHFGPQGDFAERVDLDAWNVSLDERQITDVLSFLPRSAEQAWMERHPERFVRLAGDMNWGLFRVLR
jgi:hypothetical protein